MPPARQVAFARRFGEVQIHVMNQYHADGFPELYRLSNLDADGKPNGRHPDQGTLAWHTDGSWRRVTGQATIIYGEVMPDDRAARRTSATCTAPTSASTLNGKRASPALRAVHNLDFSRTRRHGDDPMTDAQRLAMPPVDHPVVRTHPETGRKCLYLGDHAEYDRRHAVRRRSRADRGIERDGARTRTSRTSIAGQPGELIVWDNRCVMHRATTYDPATQGRVIRRCTVLGEVPV